MDTQVSGIVHPVPKESIGKDGGERGGSGVDFGAEEEGPGRAKRQRRQWRED